MFCILYSNRNVFANCNLKKNKNFESNWYFEKKNFHFNLAYVLIVIVEIDYL